MNLPRHPSPTRQRIGPCQRCGRTLLLAKSTSLWTLILGSGPERRWMCRECVADCVAEIDWLEDDSRSVLASAHTGGRPGEPGERDVA